MARKIVVEFLGSDKSASSTAAKVEQRFGKMGGRLDRIGQLAGRGLAIGLVGAGAAAVKFGKQASDLAEAQSKANVVFGDSVGVVNDFAEGAAVAAGMSKTMALEAQATLGNLLLSMGKVPSEASAMSKELVQLSADIGSFNNVDTEEVLSAMRSGLTGEIAPLRRFGVNLTDVTLKAKALELGLYSGSGALDVSAKSSAAYALILEQTTTSQGDFARTADGLANKQRILTAQMKNLGTEIGAVVLPAMVNLTTAGLKMVEWVDRNRTLVGVLVGAVAGLAAVLYTASLAMRAWSTITKIAIGVQAAFNFVMAMNPLGLVITGLVLLGGALVVAYRKSEVFRRIVDGAFRGVQAAASATFGWIKSNWPLLLAILTGPIGLAVLAIKRFDMVQVGRDLMQGLINGVKAMAGKLVSSVQGVVGDAIKAAKNLLGISSPSKVFAKIGEDTGEGLIKGLESKRTKIKDKIASLVQAASDVADSFRGGFSASLFANDFGESGPTTAGILDFQKAQAAKAAVLQQNVKALIGKGLSKDLLRQMLESGSAGQAQIAALSTASASDIGSLNSLNKATNASLSGAGAAVGDALYGDRIRGARQEVVQVKLYLDSKEIHEALLKRKRTLGRPLALA